MNDEVDFFSKTCEKVHNLYLGDRRDEKKIIDDW